MICAGDDADVVDTGDHTSNRDRAVDKRFGDLLQSEGADRFDGGQAIDAFCDGGPGLDEIVNCA